MCIRRSFLSISSYFFLYNPATYVTLRQTLGCQPRKNNLPLAATQKRKQSSSSPSTALPDATNTAWVFTLGGIVELAQALCGPPSPDQQRSRRRKDRASTASRAEATAAAEAGSEAWSGAYPLELAIPLFDILPELLILARPIPSASSATGSRGEQREADGRVVAGAEYALWLTMDVLGAVLRRRAALGGEKGKKNKAASVYDESRAGADAERVLACIRENPSPQTR